MILMLSRHPEIYIGLKIITFKRNIRSSACYLKAYNTSILKRNTPAIQYATDTIEKQPTLTKLRVDNWKGEETIDVLEQYSRRNLPRFHKMITQEMSRRQYVS